jgi:putative hydrolase of the HAD superfamily
MRVRAVVFDWYATLAAPHPEDVWTSFPELIAAAGGRPDPATITAWERGHPLEHCQHSANEAVYRAWQRDRLDSLAAACGVRGQAREALLDHIDRLRYTRLFDVYPDVRPTLIELKARGLTVAICSNWDWCLDRHLVHNGIADLLDAVVCSATVGVRKPHPAIFELLLDRTGADPGETLFVGDNWHDDVLGAQGAGLTPVHIVRSGECRTPDHDAVACVTGLGHVRTLCE